MLDSFLNCRQHSFLTATVSIEAFNWVTDPVVAFKFNARLVMRCWSIFYAFKQLILFDFGLSFFELK